MEKICITGGKGGVGKSMFAILLANDLLKKGKKVILCDCDVECPNDYLLLGQKLGKLVGQIYSEFPKIDNKKCRKCGICVKTCLSNAIFQAPEKYPLIIENLCSGCKACGIACPYGAISFYKKRTGRVFLTKVKKNFWLATGLANPGLEETGLIAAGTKNTILRLSRKINPDFILFDTAAGIHCPVVSVLIGCDSAYCLTEPTPMGAYDLSLILELCRKLGVKSKVVINQADLGDKAKVYKIAKKFKVKIEKEVPYSKELAIAYSNGNLLNFWK